MQSKVVQLSGSEHGNLKLTQNRNFDHIAKQHIAPIIFNEIAAAAADMSVVFIKKGETEDFLCVGMMGLKNDENLMVKDSRWIGDFLPAGLTHYPLSLVPNPDDQEKYIVCVDRDCESVSETEGEALFKEDGSSSEFYENRRKALENYYGASLATQAFINTLVDMDLLIPQTLTFNIGEDKRTVNGIYTVDEKKFNELSDEKYIELRKKGYILPIYSHLISLQQTKKLVKELAAR